MIKGQSNKRTIVLVLVLVILMIVAYKMLFMGGEEVLPTEENMTHEKIQKVFDELQTINFDTSIMSDSKFTSLKSIETSLPALPVGKQDPFSASSN